MGRRWGIIPTRGVYQGLAFSGALTSGSSPLARGLRGPSPPACLDLGIIPARAGFTFVPTFLSNTYEDHPRSRGVYYNEIGLESVDMGSSPLARGLPSPDVNKQNDWGIIPARAGFTRVMQREGNYDRDHPRSRGVYVEGFCNRWSIVGSSPLARGLLGGLFQGVGAVGIIPARAGFTVPVLLPVLPGRDHPRSRGVYPPSRSLSRTASGSSPLARGLRGEG